MTDNLTLTNVGEIKTLHINAKSRIPAKSVKSANFISGEGIDGDRHASSRKERQGYQVLLINLGVLNDLGLKAGMIKENITIDGVDLMTMEAGDLLYLGDDVILELNKPCAPCSRMEEIRVGLSEELAGKRGMLASVKNGGVVNIGDAVRLLTR